MIFEWNQAGGGPCVAPGTDLYDDEREALDAAAELTAAAAPRRDRYTVHEVDDEPVGGWS